MITFIYSYSILTLYLLTYLLTYLLIYLFIYLLIYLFIHLFIYSLIYSLTYLFIICLSIHFIYFGEIFIYFLPTFSILLYLCTFCSDLFSNLFPHECMQTASHCSPSHSDYPDKRFISASYCEVRVERE